MILDSKLIAVDFDGTIVENRYPKIGKEIPFAFRTLKMLQEEGHRLILWTVRVGSELEEAVEFCSKHGMKFYAINENYPGEGKNLKSRKLITEIFIDDRNVGGFPGWGEVYEMITNKNDEGLFKKKRSLFGLGA